MPEHEKFCMRCGQTMNVKAAPQAKATPPAPPLPPRSAAVRASAPLPPQSPSVYRPGMKPNMMGLWIGVAVAAVIAVVLILFFTGVFGVRGPGPNVANNVASVATAKVDVSWDSNDTLPTAFYPNTTERLIRVKLKSDQPTKVNVSVEISKITQKETKTVDVTDIEKPYDFKPAFLKEAYGPLDKAQDTFIELKVTDEKGGSIISESIPIRTLSRNDMVWVDKDGTKNYEYIARWVTKNNKEVKELVRKASDYNQRLCGQSAMVGYLGDETMVACQLASIFVAMQDYYKIKYIASAESYQTSNAQTIRLPEEVLMERSGLCIETTILVAAALENLDMEPVIIMIPGHAWVAVKVYAGAPYYFHLETTMLDASVLDAMTTAEQEWAQYGASALAIVDIKKARQDGILPFGETVGEPTMQ